MATFEALYGRPCNWPNCRWDTTDKILLRPDLFRETSRKIELIRQQMKAEVICEQMKKRGRFEVGDMMFAKVFPLRKVVRF